MTQPFRALTTPEKVRLRVEDFLRLDNAGAFVGQGKTELIRGDVYTMNVQHRPHARTKAQLYAALTRALAEVAPEIEVLIEATVAMPPHSAPEPDLVLTTEPDGEGPVPLASVRLLVEIADTTQDNDLGSKAALYAENAVPEYWVVDLKSRRVTRMWQPQNGAYAESNASGFELIESATITGLAVRVDQG